MTAQKSERATRAQLVKASDGPVSLLINRRISVPISGVLARLGMTPNMATLMALALGGGAGAAFALQVWWLGGLALQMSSIFSGVDGEIARRTGSASKYGDFLDTMADRMVEYAAVLAIAYGLEEEWGAEAWEVGLIAVGGTFLLTSASEKFRSVTGSNYPKRKLEPVFAYLASGRDVRIFYLASAAVATSAEESVIFWALVALAVLLHANFAYRIALLRRRMPT